MVTDFRKMQNFDVVIVCIMEYNNMAAAKNNKQCYGVARIPFHSPRVAGPVGYNSAKVTCDVLVLSDIN
jgi:hypothetical protein